MTLALFVMFLALACWAFAAAGVGTGRFNLIAAGLLLWHAGEKFG